MDEEILEELEKIYKFKIEVKFKDFRIYEIFCDLGSEKKFAINYLWNSIYTKEANINDISYKIDKEIANIFKVKD